MIDVQVAKSENKVYFKGLSFFFLSQYQNVPVKNKSSR